MKRRDFLICSGFWAFLAPAAMAQPAGFQRAAPRPKPRVRAREGFFEALADILKDPQNFRRLDHLPGGPALALLASEATRARLGRFGVVLDRGGYLSLTLDQEIKAKAGEQCAGFIKAASTLGAAPTTGWKEGAALSPDALPAKGEVIATFTKKKFDFYHAALVMSADREGVTVIDQNHPAGRGEGSGLVLVHKIAFDDKATLRAFDAAEYRIVT